MNGKRARFGNEIGERKANKAANRLLQLHRIGGDLRQGCWIVRGGLGKQLLRYVIRRVKGRK
jgi:hypothetical protein